MRHTAVAALVALVCCPAKGFVAPGASSLPRRKLSRFGEHVGHVTSGRALAHEGRRVPITANNGSPWVATTNLVVASAAAGSSLLAWTPATVLAAVVGASVINALQGGIRGDLGLKPDDILGVPVDEATGGHVANLGKSDFMQLFYASTCPTEGDLDGEYRARTLEMGILHPITSILTHRIWGPGRWLGKGFRTRVSRGYNLFSPSGKVTMPSEGPLPEDTLRDRTFWFSLNSNSVFDRGESSSLDYGGTGRNGPLFGGMRDEIRKVNDNLFIGLGYIQAFGGKYNTAPFILEGPPVGDFSFPTQ